MKNALMRGMLSALIFSTAALLPLRASAGDYPMTGGDFWEVTGVQLKDGGSLGYAKFLAAEWKADQEFAKSKGWIKSYMVFANAYPRKGEAHLYLVIVTDRLATGPEGDKRDDEYTAWKKKTSAQMAKESGDRLQIREIMGTELLQELKFK
ncbi:hypothetical protein ACFJGW_13730 [Burkholderiaceae bacterium UC74_6]